MRRQWAAMLLCLAVMSTNIFMVQKILNEQLVYRSNEVITAYWEAIDRTIGAREGPHLILMVGNGPKYYNVFALSGSTPLALKRGYSHVSQFPVMVYDMSKVLYFACAEKPEYTFLNINIQLPQNIAIDRIFAWDIQETAFVPIHAEVRNQIDCSSMVK